jgi:pyruvate,orthophosphate dikinase
MSPKFVFPFDYRHPQPPRELSTLLGGKGANLAEMTSVLRLPVPPGFTISTDACGDAIKGAWPDGLREEIERGLESLEQRVGRKLGDPNDPLLVSVRSGASSSMPGMLDSILNLGLNAASVRGLARQTGDERFALDSYRRFVSMYARVVLGIRSDRFDAALAAQMKPSAMIDPSGLTSGQLKSVLFQSLSTVRERTGLPFPENPREQLEGAINAVFRSWMSPRAIAFREREGIDHNLGTAVNVQLMVFGNRDERSATGVGFTRNPSTGEHTPYGDVLFNAQGEDVVGGVRKTLPLSELESRLPEVNAELLGIFDRLELHYRDMCDTEFTIEQGKLWMLQTRSGKRTGRAAVRIAVEMTRNPAIALTRTEAVSRVTDEHLEQVLKPQAGQQASSTIATGLGASPGIAVGRACFTADGAVEASERGEAVILIRSETSPEDVHGMSVAEGVLTVRGGLASHAAVIARSWGIPAVVGVEALELSTRSFSVGGIDVADGDVISIDGTTGAVSLGTTEVTTADRPEELEIILAWRQELEHATIR